MLKIMNKLFLILPLALAACNGASGDKSAQARAAEPLKLELASPDQAVKTWWRVKDKSVAAAVNRCEEKSKELLASESMSAMKNITTGLALQNTGQHATCMHFTFGREIIEVKVESETRAIVLAKIKATTPIPAGVTPDADDTRRRTEGELYKYLLEKIGTEWKIAQIYSHSSTDSDPWQPEYTEVKPYVHSLVFGDQ